MTAATFAIYVALTAFMSWVMWRWSYDDGYITYTFALNLAEGRGLTWNGEAVLGTSSPGLAVILAGLARLLPLPIPALASLLTAVFALALALALHDLGAREGLPIAGTMAGVLWIVFPLLWQVKGSEVAMGVSCVVVAAWAWRRGKPGTAGVALALAAILRTELGLAAPLLAGAAILHRGWRLGSREVARVALVSAVVFAGWLATLWMLAGQVLPRTLAAKQAQGDSPYEFWWGGPSFVRHLLRDWEAQLDGRGLWWAALALLGALWLVLARRARTAVFLGTLALWGVAHLALDCLLDIPYYGWYAFPTLLTLLLLCSFALEAGFAGAGPWPTARRIVAACALLALIGGLWVGAPRALALRMPDARSVVHCGIAKLADRHLPGTSLAAFEVGYLGYHVERARVVDLLGLVTAQTPLDAVRAGRLEDIRRTLAPELLVLKTQAEGFTRPLVGDARAFLAEYELERLQTAVIPMMVYRRLDVPPHGEVVMDLLPVLAEQGAVVEVVGLGGHGIPALRLEPGERRTVDMVENVVGAALQTSPRLFLAFGSGGPGPAAGGFGTIGDATFRAGDSSDETIERLETAAGAWSLVQSQVAWSAKTVIELVCNPDSPSPCLFGLPHLTRVDVEDPDLLAPGACEGFPAELLATKSEWRPPLGFRLRS